MIAARPGGVQNMALLAADSRYLYVPVFKAANTTVRQVLWGLAGAPLADSEMGVAYTEAGPFAPLTTLGPLALREALISRKTFRFTFVRNPYGRLLSAYRSKIAGRPWDSHRYLENLGWSAEARPTFEAFVRRVASQRDIDKDAHWLPQHRAAFLDFVTYDVIGKVETFDDDLRAILDHIAPSTSVRPRRLNPSTPDEVGYTEALAELVYRTYRRDFEIFGYDPASYREFMAGI